MKRILLLIVAIFFCGLSYSQTPYESKCFELYKKYLRIYAAGNVSNSDLEDWFRTLKLTGVYPYDYESATKETMFATSKLTYMLTHSQNNVAELENKMKAEFEAAKKLMNNDEKLGYRIIMESKTPYGKAKWNGANEFVQWAKRDEYESNADWEKRLNQEAKNVFDNIMFKHVQQEIRNDYWTMDYGRYYADAGELYLIFEDHSGVNSCGHRIQLSPQQAKNLKENNPMSKDDIIFDSDGACQTSHGAQELSFYYDYEEICKVEDTDAALIPRYFYIEIGSQLFKLDNKNFLTSVKLNVLDVQYKFADLSITDSKLQFLKGHTFSYKQYFDNNRERELLERKEQAIRDSIAKREKFLKDSLDCVLYTKMIDSVYTSFNKDFAEDKYNIENIRITEKGIISPTDPSGSYEKALSKMRDERHKKKLAIMDKYEKYWKEYGNGVYFSKKDEFDKFYCKGIDSLNVEVEYRSIKIFVDKYCSMVAQIDFQKPKTNSFLAEYLDTQKDYSDINTIREVILDAVGKCKGHSSYERVIDYLLLGNSKMRTEYQKNGSKFASLAEFFESYTSGYYKTYLKMKK